MAGTETWQHTPLRGVHVASGARMVPFGGWEMPVQYTGILEEHAAVREAVGLFDISHMGEFVVAGRGATATLNRLLTNNVQACAVGQAQYTLMCNPQGGVIDDLIVYHVRPDFFYLVVNASNIDADFDWIHRHLEAGTDLKNESDHTAAVALQGPKAVAVIPEASDITHFRSGMRTIGGVECFVARTGYTGEDGFELFCNADLVETLWNELLHRGRPHGIKPCGLGARDTLRLEMGYPLHGQDITPQTTPIEAGLGRYVSLEKGDFIGRDVLAAQKEKGVSRKLIAFQMTEKSPPPRPHYRLLRDGRAVGEVTSGTQSPSMGIGIGMGYVETDASAINTPLHVEIRGRPHAAIVTKKPIWNRKS
jgi:aminomethyltransferase